MMLLDIWNLKGVILWTVVSVVAVVVVREVVLLEVVKLLLQASLPLPLLPE